MTDFPSKTVADWEKLARKELRDRPLEDLVRMTPEGIPVKPLYTAADLEGLPGLASLGITPAALDTLAGHFQPADPRRR